MKIKIGALGGCGEHGKNCYFVEIDEKIILLDCGSKNPSSDYFGVDKTIPSFEYLEDKKDNILGLFISHAHEDNLGALPFFTNKFPEVKVYGSAMTIEMARVHMADMFGKKAVADLNVVSEEDIVEFENCSVSFFQVTHIIPECFGISIETADGLIVYAADFTFTNSADAQYRTSFGKIVKLGEKKVLALLSESLGTSNTDGISTDYYMERIVREALESDKRVIFSMFSSDIHRIKMIINLAVEYKKAIAMVGNRTQKLIHVARKFGYLSIPEDRIGFLKLVEKDEEFEYIENSIVIVPGMKHEPYYTLQRMCDGKDKLVKITEKDKVVIISPLFSGIERIALKTLDVLARYNIDVVEIKKQQLKNYHADSEDLKMLYEMLKPKYIIPIIGEYRHQYKQRIIAQEAGYHDVDVLMIDNGELITIVDEVSIGSREQFKIGEILLDGNSQSSDITTEDDSVIRERENLSENGLLIIVIDVKPINNKFEIIVGPKILPRGFIFLIDLREELEGEIIDIVSEFIYNANVEEVDLGKLQSEINRAIYKHIDKKLDKTPVVTTIIKVIEDETIEKLRNPQNLA